MPMSGSCSPTPSRPQRLASGGRSQMRSSARRQPTGYSPSRWIGAAGSGSVWRETIHVCKCSEAPSEVIRITSTRHSLAQSRVGKPHSGAVTQWQVRDTKRPLFGRPAPAGRDPKETLAARITFTSAAATNGPATLIARLSSEVLSRHGNPAMCRCPLHALFVHFIRADTPSHRPIQACRRSPAWGSSGSESTASHRS